MSDVFDDGRLEDPRVLAAFDGAAAPPRRVGRPGADRGRRRNVEALAALEAESQPRAVVAAGEDARLLRAVLEPWCPVPFVAWPGPGPARLGRVRSTWSRCSGPAAAGTS